MATGGTTPPRAPNLSALSRLNDMSEPKRRRALRSHVEVGVEAQNEIELRRQLDQELVRLTGEELHLEIASDARQRAQEIFERVPEFVTLVRDSPAFAQYLNTYLYFGIRFLAGRLGEPQVAPPEEGFNEGRIGLPRPPAFESTAFEDLGGDVDYFLSLPQSEEIQAALDFLDGYVTDTDGMSEFDLWLRGLLPKPKDSERFHKIAKGLYEWACQRYEFYARLERRNGGAERVERWREGKHVEGTWHARNPLAARCGVADLYWLAGILRAEVSPRCVVRYSGHSWLHYLPLLAPDDYSKDRILHIQDVLQSAFDFACDLIQNAVEMTEYFEKECAQPEDFPKRPSGSLDWRAAQDREIDEISNHRRERLYAEDEMRRSAAGSQPIHGLSDMYWSRRIRTGEYETNLVGVALSGGGIRSATFALGVLQRLKELDLLRRVDYLSTVSGGGYIGAWLVGNVRRTRYWLSRMTSWDESIDYLRNYSKYLSPQSGILSADSWVIWGTWIRNAMLIQLTAVAWLSALFVAALAVKTVFDLSRDHPSVNLGMRGFLAVSCVVLAVYIGKNLLNPNVRGRTQHRKVVLLAWVSSFCTAALLWNGATKAMAVKEYSAILRKAVTEWPWYLTAGLVFSFYVLALASVLRPKKGPEQLGLWNKSRSVVWFIGRKTPAALGIALTSSGVVYLAVCAVVYLFGVWAWLDKDLYGWYAYVFGPALVLLAMTLALVIFIGLVGRASADWRREWWTRYGSWLAIYGAGFLALGVAAVFGNVWLKNLFALGQKVKWASVVGWIGSVIAGLLAGNSSKTRGNGEGSSKAFEWVARLGGVLFVGGAVLALSSVLHLVLVEVWLDKPEHGWWQDLNRLLATGHSIEFLPGAAACSDGAILLTLVLLVICGFLFSWRFNLNIFGLNQFYRNRLVRCYLGATRWKPGLRRPDRFTGFDENDDLSLADLQFESPSYGDHFRGPFPLVNCSLNLGGSSDLAVKTRQSASFTMTPLNCGSARPRIGFAPLETQGGFADGVSLGQAISVSGAAASPNMGYNTSPLVSVLLTMFNVRLAWWFPNPGRKKWKRGSSPLSLLYLVEEFLGMADETSDYVNVSDGGHFENLGIYELVRRRAKVIIVSDAECDPDLSFGSLGNVIRICETDFGAKIDIDVASIRKQENGQSRAHCAVGRITYSNGSQGYLIYLKASITGDEDVGIEQYRSLHPDFPHQSTGDQFFTEDQFESYRRLGHHIASLAFRDAESGDGDNLVEIAGKLYDVWIPAGFTNVAFVKHTELLDRLWDRFRTSGGLGPLLQELMADRPGQLRPGTPSREELCACLELVQLMENVFLDLRLDDFWEHPDNRGWALLFTRWAKSPTFQAVWQQIRHTYGIRFEYFCEQRLGLEADHPVVRV